MSLTIPPPQGLPVLPPIIPYKLPELPEGKIKAPQNALQGSATPSPGATSVYDITV